MVFPKYEDFKAPWEEAGEDVDAEKAKKLVYNARKGEHDATEKVKSKTEELTVANEALETFKSAEAASRREKETDVDKLKRELAEKDAALAEAQKDKGPSRETLLLKVALEKGLTEAQAQRLVGTSLEELQADADDYLKDLPAKAGEHEEEPEGEESDGLRRQPTTKVRTPGDPGGDSPTDIGKAIAANVARNPLIA